MNVAVYADDGCEQQQISDALKKCGSEFLRPVRVTPFADYTSFCHALTLRPFDLLVIAQIGTFSLELMTPSGSARRTHLFPGFPIWTLPCVRMSME